MKKFEQVFNKLNLRQKRIYETLMESGAKEKEREIGFNEIAEILNFNISSTSGETRHQIEMRYIESTKVFIGQKGLNNYIIIKKIDEDEDEDYFKRKISLINSGYKIIFQNLFIIGPYYKKIDMPHFFFSYVVFKNNCFSYHSKESTINYNKLQDKLKPKDEVSFLKYSGVKFENNNFLDVGLNLENGESEDLNKFVIIKNNIIPFIQPSKYASIDIKGCNIIDRINIFDKNKQNKFNISWSMHQEIDPDKKFYITNKEFFIALKKIAVEKNDKFQETLVNREILRCDDYFIQKEETRINSWQDRLIMWFGRTASSHGVSWVRPIVSLSVMNLFFALLIYDIAGIGCILGIADCVISFWYVLIEMFNPLSSLSETTKIDNFFISFVNVIQKFVFAVLVYELIRVGRRFVAK